METSSRAKGSLDKPGSAQQGMGCTSDNFPLVHHVAVGVVFLHLGLFIQISFWIGSGCPQVYFGSCFSFLKINLCGVFEWVFHVSVLEHLEHFGFVEALQSRCGVWNAVRTPAPWSLSLSKQHVMCFKEQSCND